MLALALALAGTWSFLLGAVFGWYFGRGSRG